VSEVVEPLVEARASLEQAPAEGASGI
jgi:hypothetical protein